MGRGVSSSSGGAGREVSRPSLSEVTITKRWDQFTPLLLGEATVGDARSTVKFTFSDQSGAVVGTITLSEVYVSGESLSYGGDLAGAGESVSLNFVKIAVDFQGQQFSYGLATGVPS